MEYTRRKLFIMYSTILIIFFFIGGIVNSDNNKVDFLITCENGTIEKINLSDKYICGGHKNPLRNNIIEINLSLVIENLNN